MDNGDDWENLKQDMATALFGHPLHFCTSQMSVIEAQGTGEP